MIAGRAWALGLFCLTFGCSSEQGDEKARNEQPVRLTTEVTLIPAMERKDPADSRSPSKVEEREAMLAEGYGDLVEAGGEPFVTRAPPGVTVPAAGPNATRLVRFVHMPDLQLPDDESPTRMALFDSPGKTNGSYRPQDGYICHMVDAAVRTVNELNARQAIDFLLLGGDNADSAQSNEVDWVLGLLSGRAELECDSGNDDDPRPGQGNDPKDPFAPRGLDIPWYWVTGNHDVLVMGNFPVTEQKQNDAMGNNAINGTRDWSQPGAPVVKGEIIADAARKPLVRSELMSRIAADGGGHGLGPTETASGKAIYTFDVAGTPLRFLVLDTAAETGGSEGLVRQGDMDGVIQPTLDQAKADGKLVILASHHATSSLGDGTGLGGELQTDAVLEPAYLDFIGGYDNVLFSMVGHSHQNRVVWTGATGKHAWWEVMTSALADFPHQIRLIEIWDQDNGYLMLRAANVDFSSLGDPVAEEARILGTLDYVAGWSRLGRGNPEDRNVELWIQKPQ